MVSAAAAGNLRFPAQSATRWGTFNTHGEAFTGRVSVARLTDGMRTTRSRGFFSAGLVGTEVTATVWQPSALVEAYGVDADLAEDLGAQYNVAPIMGVYAVLERAARDSGEVERQLRSVRWGVVPSWAKDTKIGSRLINARVETVAEKPSWRNAYRRRRCVLPADGYFEWMTENDPHGKAVKQPYYLHAASGGLSFAGVYELWPDPSKAADDPDRWLWTAAILTCASEGPAGHIIHARMPMIVPKAHWTDWLDPRNTEPADVMPLMSAPPEGSLDIYAVSRLVSNVRNNGPELIEPLSEDRP